MESNHLHLASRWCTTEATIRPGILASMLATHFHKPCILMVFRASANFHAWYYCYPFHGRKGNAPSNPLALSRLLTTPENVLGIASLRRPSSPRRGDTASPGDQNAHLRLSSDWPYYITFYHVWEAICDWAHGKSLLFLNSWFRVRLIFVFYVSVRGSGRA